jgi:hypothetical protein
MRKHKNSITERRAKIVFSQPYTAETIESAQSASFLSFSLRLSRNFHRLFHLNIQFSHQLFVQFKLFSSDQKKRSSKSKPIHAAPVNFLSKIETYIFNHGNEADGGAGLVYPEFP